MTWMVVLLIAVTIWAFLENYWRRYHADRAKRWQQIAGAAMKERAEVRSLLRSDRQRRSRA